ncbi:hypothetical protein FF38_01883 [Lucilia cuprina]|uniref:MADF domain-containing protein n=1 Tax=Lucilia cuprina TaxID=7375 RepID=A0A0L0BQE1_LUCCU|nr:hypothetical protein FF38_01883 [Lucilia cuprina]
MQIPEEMCIQRWACLRDRYAREKRQGNLPSGSGAKPESYWKLMHTMDFIAPHIIPRATRCSKNIANEIESLTTEDISYQQYTVSPVQISSIFLDESQSSTTLSSTSQSSTYQSSVSEFSPISPSPTTSTVPKRKRNNPETDDEINFTGAIESFKKLLATIQSMGPVKQMKAIQKVTSIVMEMKLEPDD